MVWQILLWDDARPLARTTTAHGPPRRIARHVQNPPRGLCRAHDTRRGSDRTGATQAAVAARDAHLRGADLAADAVRLQLPERPGGLQRPPPRGLRRQGPGDHEHELAQAGAGPDDL